jgi:predicted RNA methylase
MKHGGKEMNFCHFIYDKIRDGEKMNKRDTERFAAYFDIFDKNAVKELCELAIVFRARHLAQRKKSLSWRYLKIVSLYSSQVNLSHRTSQSVMLQQYSTPAPIAFLAGTYILSAWHGASYFEPSAGNGLLTIALPADQIYVNEIDDFRSKNLAEQDFGLQLQQDATEPFYMDKAFDGVITNPPFGKMDKPLIVDGFPINTLDHVMAIRALDCMKDNGKAAIIIGGHTEWDSEGRIKAGKNRIFFSYLYKHYHVEDVINIDGDLYSRQGTSFDVRLILIDGRKAKPEGYPPLKSSDMATVKDFNALYDRVKRLLNKDEITENTVIDDTVPLVQASTRVQSTSKRHRIVKAAAIAKLKKLELDMIGIGNIKVKNRKLSAYTHAKYCTDLTDLRGGANEITDAIEWRKYNSLPIPDYYYIRLEKIMDKIDKFKLKNVK